MQRLCIKLHAYPFQFETQRRRDELTSRSSAAISLTFIVLVTPWAIQLVITSVTRTKVE